MKQERDSITVAQLERSGEWDGDIIYFILSPLTKKVKIGRSSNTAFIKRLNSLQTSCPDQLEVVGIAKGGLHEERRIHGEFLNIFYRGEWYNYTKEIREYIRKSTTSIVIHRKAKSKKMHEHKQEWHIVPVIWCDVCKCWHELEREKQLEWPPERCNKWGKD